MIELDHLDPDWNIARKHGSASKPGLKPERDKDKKMSTFACKCCFEVVYKEHAPLCDHSKELQFLGFGYPLFYAFLKNCIMYLLILICTYNAFSLKRAIDNNYDFCHGDHHRRLLGGGVEPYCSTWMIEFSRIQKDNNSDEEVLRIISFIAQLLFLVYMRDNLMKMEAYYDERTTSLSDYSIILKNIPKQPKIQKKLGDFFQTSFLQPHKIMKIVLVPQYKQIEDLQKEKHEVINRLRKIYDKEDFDEEMEDFKENNKQFQEIQQRINVEVQKAENAFTNDEIECERAFIIFNTEVEKQEVIDEFKKKKRF